MKPDSTERSIGFVSLGCPKATVDSERILSALRADGYQVSPTYESADAVIVNTCGFVDDAIDESLSAINEALQENGKVIVTGCLGAKSELIKSKFPSVLSVTGPQATDAVMNSIREHFPLKKDPKFDLTPTTNVRLTPRHYAYLKISEGCNHSCTFCIIPSMRGKLVSRPIGSVLEEAKTLANSGVRELLVISQDTGAFGIDKKFRTDFWNGRPLKTKLIELAKALSELGIWIRMHYVYPYPHVDELIPLMAEGKILPYLDVPFQHASERILRLMRRPANVDNVLGRIKKWRQICPEISIRSTFIVGFPGETDNEFSQLLDFLTEAQLDHVGCFEYSPVEGAAANLLDEKKIPDDVKADRKIRFMEHQQAISAQRLSKKIGTQQLILIDGMEDDATAIGRTRFDAPEIDGKVFIENSPRLEPGDLVKVTITDSDEYDLYARGT